MMSANDPPILHQYPRDSSRKKFVRDLYGYLLDTRDVWI